MSNATALDLPPPIKGVLVVGAVAMIIVTMGGNAMVCLAVLLVRTLKQPPNFLLVSLAVADFFVGCFVMPIALLDALTNEWPLGHAGCLLWTTADFALCTASIVNLCAISVDRYLVISRPLRYSAQRTTKRVMLYILTVWIIAAIVAISSIFFAPTWDHESKSHTCQVNNTVGYQIYATVVAFYFPTAVMVIVYAKIWSAAKRLAKQDRMIGVDSFHITKTIPDRIPAPDKRTSSTSQGSEGKDERRLLHRPSTILHSIKFHHLRHTSSEHHSRSENKAMKTLGVMMGIYIICWLPFFVYAIVKTIIEPQPGALDTILLWLGYSNSMLNPMIYCKYNKEFRVPFREMLCCRFRTLQNVMRHEEFNNKFGEPKRRTESIATNGNCECPIDM